MQLRRTRNRDFINCVQRLAKVAAIGLLMTAIREDEVSVRGHIVNSV